MHELCYAVSDNPLSGFRYGGVIVSNCDIGIDSYKPAAKPAAFGANNHGSIVEIEGEWYIFYHRHTNNTWYSRQGCAEKLSFDGDKIIQAEMTSCGLNDGPLKGEGEYPSFIACNIFTKDEQMYVGGAGHPYIMQDGVMEILSRHILQTYVMVRLSASSILTVRVLPHLELRPEAMLMEMLK